MAEKPAVAWSSSGGGKSDGSCSSKSARANRENVREQRPFSNRNPKRKRRTNLDPCLRPGYESSRQLLILRMPTTLAKNRIRARILQNGCPTLRVFRHLLVEDFHRLGKL